MLLKAYTIYDSKALQYHSPFYAVSDGAAVRSMTDLANDLNTQVGRHPRDYSLWLCGIYDDNNGHFTPQVPLVHVCDANALVRSEAQPSLFPSDSAGPGQVPVQPEATPIKLRSA